MGMTHCKECAAIISDAAKACPKCGAPKPAKQGSLGKKALVWIVIALAIGLLIDQTNKRSDGGSSTVVPSTSPVDPMSQRVTAAAHALPLLRSMLRNPKSFELAAVGSPADGVACYEYRAQNGFGGLSVEHAVLVNHTMSIESSDGFPATWRKYCGKPVADITQDVKRIQDLFPDR
jgi:hypothetical protein